MLESVRTPHSQFGQRKISGDEKGSCFTETSISKDPSKKRKLFSAPKFVASLANKKNINEMDMLSQKKSFIPKVISGAIEKKLKQIEVIEENPYVMAGVTEGESYSSLNDLDQDQKVFIDVQNANSLNIFRQRKQTPNYTEHNIGPRFANDGKVIKRSILGKPDAFTKMQNVMFKNTTEIPNVLKERKTSMIKNPTKDKISQANKSYTSLHSMSSINVEEPGGENKKKKGAPSAISAKKPENETGKFHFMTRIGKDDLLQDIAKVEQRHVANTANDKILLENLPPHDKRFFTKEQRILEKFKQTRDIWEKKAEVVAHKVNRKVDTCVMSKTDEFRLRLENAQTLDLLKNDDEKYGNKYWYLTLRDYPNQTRPETNTIFKKSKMNFNKNNLEIVRKDEESHKSPKKILTVYGQNEYLIDKLQKNKKKLQVILPTDDDNFFAMQVN